MNYLHQNKTQKIIQAFYKVYNTLGFGFLERVYQNSLFLELKDAGFQCQAQQPIKVYYNDHQVGDYYADIIVDNSIILELKATEALCEEHEFQLINYLKATEIEVGLLLNFGKNRNSKEKFSQTTEKN